MVGLREGGTMQELIDKVQELVAFELERANTIHPPKFNSYHEAYAVTLEEIEETLEALESLERKRDLVWACIKGDVDPCRFLEQMEKAATMAASEMIQVAAMAKKARM